MFARDLMRTLFVGGALVAGLAVAVPSAWAQGAENAKEGEESEPLAGPNCDVTGYKSERSTLTPPFAIPDNVPADAQVGPPLLMPADGDIINDVILEITWAHTWAGDIVLTLAYDADCTGPGAEIPIRVVCRPRGTAAIFATPCGTGTGVGCGANLGTSATNSLNQPATYFFSDEAVAPIAEGACPTLAGAGCYKPSNAALFSVFRGLNKGGCWSLRVSDRAALDTGTITSWAVHVRNQRPVPTTAATWGQVKSVYR